MLFLLQCIFVSKELIPNLISEWNHMEKRKILSRYLIDEGMFFIYVYIFQMSGFICLWECWSGLNTCSSMIQSQLTVQNWWHMLNEFLKDLLHIWTCIMLHGHFLFIGSIVQWWVDRDFTFWFNLIAFIYNSCLFYWNINVGTRFSLLSALFRILFMSINWNKKYILRTAHLASKGGWAFFNKSVPFRP